MTSFFVGQRVRVNCEDSEAHGVECRIIALNQEGIDLDRGVIYMYRGHEVDVPHGDECDGVVFEEHELDPILPDGHRASEESLEELLPFLKEQKVSA